jgi:hypothetical protein
MAQKPRSEADKLLFLGQLTERELSQADGQGDEIEANRKQARAYYAGAPRGDEIANRSGVISTDVADMTNAVLAMLVPMLSTDAVVEFEPEGEDDELQAKAESDVVNRVIIEDSRGWVEIQEAIKDGLLMRNSCMKVRVETYDETRTFNIEDASEDQRRALVNGAPEDNQHRIVGDMLVATRQSRRFVVSAVPIENVTYQAGYTGRDLQGIRFFAEALEYTRSDLREMGIAQSVVDGLKPYGVPLNTTRNKPQRGTAQTKDQDIIQCHEVYILCDMNGDGVSERYKCLVANNHTCLSYEPADLVPYALGTPFVNPHSLTGESLFDHTKASQDVKTSLIRQLLDNTAAINNGRYIYNPARTNEDDVLNPKPGGGIRSTDPLSVVPVPIPDVTSGILMALQYEDKRRTERGGAALELTTGQAQLVGETAFGIDRQYAAREAMVSMMAANFSETLLRGIYLLTHEFLRRYATQPFTVRLKGAFTEVDPREWKPRTRLNVKTGMSPGARGHLQNALAQTMQLQATAMQAGLAGVLASPTTVYRVAIDWLRMAGVANPERLWIDPDSDAAKKAQEASQKAAQEQQQAQMQLVQAQLELERLKIRQQDKEAAGKLAHDYYDTDTRAAIEEAKLAGNAVVQLETTRMTTEAHKASAEKRSTAAKAVGRD